MGDNEGSWLAVLSGRTGKLLWKEKLGPTEAMSLAPVLMDLDGKTIVFLVAWTTSRESGGEPTGCELRALDGRDGKLLWRQPLSKTTVDAKLLCVGPHKAGSAEVVVTAALARVFDRPNFTNIQVFAFNASNGERRWQWSGPENVHYLAYFPTLADLSRKGRLSLCLLTAHQDGAVVNGEPCIVVRPRLCHLDPEGKLRWTMDLKPLPLDKTHQPGAPHTPSGQERIGPGLWSHDLNGDGKEEVVFINGYKVQAVSLSGGGRQPPKKPLWQWPLPTGAGEILDIHPAGKGRPAVVVVRSGKAAYGLDGPTGRLRWRCDGPGRPVACLAPCSTEALPTVWFHTSKPESTICLQALPVGPDGKYRVPAARFIEPPAEDIGLIVPLPWVSGARQRLPHAILPAVFCLALLAYVVWKREWRLTIALFACLLVIPLGFAGLKLTPIRQEWLTGSLAILMLLLPVGLLEYVVRKQKGLIAIPLLVCLLVIPMSLSGSQFTKDFKFEEQRYTWEDWYLIWPYVLSAGGEWTPKVLLACLVAWLIWRVAWPMLRKVKRPAAPEINH
jgi:outer membrane protein assembly factor BamB